MHRTPLTWPSVWGDGCVGASLSSRCSGGAHAAGSIAGAVGVAAVGACQDGVLTGLALGGALLAGMVGGVVVCSAEPAAWFGGSAALPVMAEALALLALIRGAGRKVALGA